MAPRPVPVVIVAGHLGAGKTTVVNHLLRHADGRRIGVVVNDFGAVEVDAMLVAGRADAVASLAGGCLCCEVDANGLADLLSTLTAPRAGLDLVVVEASGLAEPKELVRLLLDARATDAHVGYGGLVVVVDAAAPELAHVALADLVVVNKIDRCDDPDATLAEVRDRAAGAVLATTRGALDPALLVGESRRPAPVSAQLSFDALLTAPTEHAHAAYDRVEHHGDRPLDPARLVAFLEAGPAGVYRAKGFVRLAGEPRTWEVQTVGTAIEFRLAPRGVPDPGGASLVLIGAGIDGPALRTALDGCVAAEAVGEHAMLAVLRHVPD